ncbi:Hypothetical protein R9X50_00077700 [Acrodontium crateriforme]|uniref:Checkpoint protein RAD24-like helical bundle domain-containing protein n=1 Tax=Acrodontium crateriforme TaxID=150365 RepID=A0AAQ3LZG1_9PEZI|nr:Hypothetical protein R9X50_00077700 [Acrodontium crateriforme]
MGQPRASRRKPVTIVSDDDEEELQPEAQDPEPSDDDEPVKARDGITGQLKRIVKSKKLPGSDARKSITQKSPPKPRATKAKSKSVVKDGPKPNVKPIYSFFNAATERQRTPQPGSVNPSPSPEKAVLDNEQLETIQDESGDDAPSSLSLSKGSSIALTMRKRKFQMSQSSTDDKSSLLPPTQKFRKTSDTSRVTSFALTNEDKRPWIEQFAPIDLTELAVHKRKVGNVRQWLELALRGKRQKVLVLKGPAGAGKTATIQLLAADLGCEILEWRNPGGMDVAAEGSASAATQFEEFVGRAGKATGLTLTTDTTSQESTSASKISSASENVKRKRQILLIEEFPNTFSRTSTILQSFRSTLLQYVSSIVVAEGSSTPIIMIISETLLSTNTAAADSFTAHRLLGPELSTHSYIDMIEFNPVATTFLTKALEMIVIKEARKSGRRRTPGPPVLKHIAETGDIRSAVSTLEFLCLRGDGDDIWSSKVNFTKPKKSKSDAPLTEAETEALKLISNRESTIDIFHAVGKVMYNKRVDPPSKTELVHPPSWLPQHRRAKVPEVAVDPLIDEVGTDTSTFIASLHENYPPSCSNQSSEESLDSLNGCIDSISDADLLSVDHFSLGTRAYSGSATDSLRQDEMAFQVSVRGILFGLPFPVHRSMSAGTNRADAHKMFYPTSLKTWRKKEEIGDLLELLTAKVQNGTLEDSRRVVNDNGGGTARGVDAWQTKKSFTSDFQENLKAHDRESIPPMITSTSRTELLLERLPYMSIILGSKSIVGQSSLFDQIASVTQVRGQIPVNEDDEYGIAEEERDASGLEQWTTDRPDDEIKTQPLKTLSKGKQKAGTEGRGMMIPVEDQVEALVLVDDDIVDD